jgi:rhodanese-like protein
MSEQTRSMNPLRIRVEGVSRAKVKVVHAIRRAVSCTGGDDVVVGGCGRTTFCTACIVLGVCSLVLTGCVPDSGDAEETEAGGEIQLSQGQSEYNTWPTTAEGGRIRQATKHVEALKTNPTLIMMSDLPGGEMPAWDIDLLGIARVETLELEELVRSGRWALVDVRKDKDITTKGTIPGSYHFEYKYEGATYSGKTRLTDGGVESLLRMYDGVVLFCNGPKCPRSFNGSVHLVQDLGVDGKRVRWYRSGVPGWTQSPLIPVTRDAPDTKAPDTTVRVAD